MLIYCSAAPAVMGTGSSYVNAWRAHHEDPNFPTGLQNWANAFYTYWPGNVGAFTSDWQSVVTAYPQGIATLASPKGTPETSAGADPLNAFCTQLPQAWRDKMMFAYWQEPGNDFGGAGQPAISVYRGRVSAMADIVRPYGIRNAVHVEEWDINPFNNASGSTQAQRFAHLAQFVQGIEDKIDVVSWSLYPAEGNSMVEGMVRMEAWMDQFLPGHQWEITATSSPVNVGRPLDAPQRVTRANIVRAAGDHIVARTNATGRGPRSFGWFHFTAFGGNNKDNLATTDQHLYDALQYVASLELDEPDPEPPGGKGGVDLVSHSVRVGGSWRTVERSVHTGGGWSTQMEHGSRG